MLVHVPLDNVAHHLDQLLLICPSLVTLHPLVVEKDPDLTHYASIYDLYPLSIFENLCTSTNITLF